MLQSNQSRRCRLSVNQLESREVPATFVNSTTMTYQDIDGDNVRLVFTKPILSQANLDTIFTFSTGPVAGNGTPQQLQSINLAGLTAAAGTRITTTATRSTTTGGDGFAALGQINATGIDLGAVTIDGDLAKIVAGDATPTTTGLFSLTAQSMGRFGLFTGAADLISTVQGPVGSFVVRSNVNDVKFNVQGGANGKMGRISIGGSLVGGSFDTLGTISAVTIGGSIIGGNDTKSGSIISRGKITAVNVGGSITGGIGQSSGTIFVFNPIVNITIGQSLIGGSGAYSGNIGTSNFEIGNVNIGGSIQGGSGYGTGRIESGTTIGAITLGGSIQGGSGQHSGQINARVNTGRILVKGSLIGGTADGSGQITLGGFSPSITINGDLIGGSASGTQDLAYSGTIQARQIPSLTIGGSAVSGIDTTTGDFIHNGDIIATENIDTVLINGSIIGNATNPFVIQANSTSSSLALGRLTVKQDVQYALIQAGYVPTETSTMGEPRPANADAQIGTITVLGDWIASSVSAGVSPTNGFYGDGDDAKMAGVDVVDSPTVKSKINSVSIGGQILGTIGGSDSYGIVAETIGSIKIGGTAIPLLNSAVKDNIPFGLSNDFRILEL